MTFFLVHGTPDKCIVLDFLQIENGATQGKEGDQGGGSGFPGTSGGYFNSFLYALINFKQCTTLHIETDSSDPSLFIWATNLHVRSLFGNHSRVVNLE